MPLFSLASESDYGKTHCILLLLIGRRSGSYVGRRIVLVLAGQLVLVSSITDCVDCVSLVSTTVNIVACHGYHY